MTHPLSWSEVFERCSEVIEEYALLSPPGNERVWGIPRGGTHVAGILGGMGVVVADKPHSATVAVDDILDSGATATRVLEQYDLKTIPLFVKNEMGGEWVVFPWETDEGDEHYALRATVVRQLQLLGEDPNRPGLQDTPERVASALREATVGYRSCSPSEWLKTFQAEDAKLVPFSQHSMVLVRDIQFSSLCEHHMMPFMGTVDVAYWPNLASGVIGLSKIPRVVQAVSRKLQLQERFTQEIVEAICSVGVHAAVRVRARHTCTANRGVRQTDTSMETTAYSQQLTESQMNEFARRIA